MSPFDKDYTGQVAEHMTTKQAKASATASRRAAEARQRGMQSDDPSKRMAAKGCIWGMGVQKDPGKAGAIKKPSQM